MITPVLQNVADAFAPVSAFNRFPVLAALEVADELPPRPEGPGIVVTVLALAAFVIFIAAFWKLFTKAGEPVGRR